MIPLFLAAFIIGLLLAVRVMLYGVERGGAGTPHRAADPLTAPPAPVRVRSWEPAVAAFASVFGFAGYLLARDGRDPRIPVLIATTLGVGAVFVALRVVRKAVAFVPEHDPDDPRYVLQGHVARVTAPIDGTEAGEITFEVEGDRRTVPARGFEGATARLGEEVVIERIGDDGVAWVESWAEVEKRL